MKINKEKEVKIEQNIDSIPISSKQVRIAYKRLDRLH